MHVEGLVPNQWWNWEVMEPLGVSDCWQVLGHCQYAFGRNCGTLVFL